MKTRKVILSGGGTGGHFYPALAVGQKLKEKDPLLQLIFVGSSRETEKKIMDHHGAHFIPLKIEGLKGKGLKTIKSLLLLPASFIKSLAILFRAKPSLVIGVGGFSSGPLVLLASWLKYPTLILEQNICPGLTNRLLIPWVKKAVVSFENSLPYFKGKGIFIGNPVREEFYKLPPKERNANLTLLIFGGSQGYHFINEKVVSSLTLIEDKKNDLKILHQTGGKDFQWVKENYEKHNFNDAVISPYFFDMPDRFKKVDIVVGRAGATTIAELIASRKASLLIPFSKAADNHQTLNARELEKIGGADVLLEENFTPKVFAEKINFYLKNKEKITLMEKNLIPMKRVDVSENIANLCFQLMKIES